MMGCTCRVTPLRIFVQGLSQVHKLEAPPSFIRLRTPAARPALYQNHFALSRQTRSLHASKQLSQDAAGANSSSTGTDLGASTPSEHGAPAVSNETTEPNLPSEPPNISRPSQTQPIPESQASEQAQSQEAQTRKRVKRETDNSWKNSDASRGVFVEKPKGPSPGEPQSKADLWKSQKAALKEKFPEGWRPRKRLSPDALAGIRALNAQFPDVYTTAALAQKFEVSPEVIRRILRSKWQPTVDEEEKRQERWFRRGQNVWEQKAALGIKPPQKWRREGIARDPSYHVWRKEAVKRNREAEERDDRQIRGGFASRPGRGRP
ncbi:hypothetical protein ACJ41O_013931 [Fusarium nematophilum]